MSSHPASPSQQPSQASAVAEDRLARPPIPASLGPLLPEYEFEQLDVERHAVTIIERTLEHGNQAEVRWMLGTYGVDRVREVVRTRGARQLTPRAFTFWRLVLDVTAYQPPPWPETARALWNPGG